MMSPTLANEAINAISVRFESIMTFQNLSHLLYFMIHTDMPIEFLVLITGSSLTLAKMLRAEKRKQQAKMKKKIIDNH